MSDSKFSEDVDNIIANKIPLKLQDDPLLLEATSPDAPKMTSQEAVFVHLKIKGMLCGAPDYIKYKLMPILEKCMLENDFATCCRIIRPQTGECMNSSLLSMCARFGHIETFDKLMSHPSADINLHDTTLDTPLKMAIIGKQKDMLAHLLSHEKIQFNTGMNSLDTPVMLALIFWSLDNARMIKKVADERGLPYQRSEISVNPIYERKIDVYRRSILEKRCERNPDFKPSDVTVDMLLKEFFPPNNEPEPEILRVAPLIPRENEKDESSSSADNKPQEKIEEIGDEKEFPSVAEVKAMVKTMALEDDNGPEKMDSQDGYAADTGDIDEIIETGDLEVIEDSDEKPHLDVDFQEDTGYLSSGMEEPCTDDSQDDDCGTEDYSSGSDDDICDLESS